MSDLPTDPPPGLHSPQPWKLQALCRVAPDPSVFFPDQSEPQKRREAKAYCAVCPVAEQCLEYALSTKQYWGIWGGLTERERRRLRVARRSPTVLPYDT